MSLATKNGTYEEVICLEKWRELQLKELGI
jgi:hypothetical protein